MAPFNTHFLVAEKLWPELEGPWGAFYGQFCFGCIAPDVDKLSALLTQKDTHFFDRSGPWDLMASHRSVEFIRCQPDFFHAPFNELQPEEQAFALGYLCHLCVDEVSKHMWRRETWLNFKAVGPGPAFAALDEAARQRIDNYSAIKAGLAGISVLDLIPRIPITDLSRLLQGARNFVAAPTVEAEFLALVDMFDSPSPEKREQWRASLHNGLDFARRHCHYFQIDGMLAASLNHSRRRLADFLAGRVPEPGFPDLETRVAL